MLGSGYKLDSEKEKCLGLLGERKKHALTFIDGQSVHVNRT